MTQGLVEEGVAPASREDELLRRSFLRFLRAEGIRPTTIQRYDLSIRQFEAFARQMGFPKEVTGEHVAHFLAWGGRRAMRQTRPETTTWPCRATSSGSSKRARCGTTRWPG